MAGLMDLFGVEANPFLDWTRARSNTLMGLGAGIAQGTNFGEGVSQGLRYAQQGQQIDQTQAEKLKADTLATAQANATQTWLAQNHPDLADMVKAGMPVSEAWELATKRMNPTPPKATDAPSGYQWGPEGTLSFIPGGPADPANRRSPGAPTATVMNEIFAADEGAQAGQNVLQSLDKALELNSTAWDGPGADLRSGAAALTPWGGQGAVDTQTLQNLVTANALESLKATFGAAPTEGERKILLEVQGSVNQPRAVREEIFKRAKAAAERRLAFNTERARALRSGDYFDAGYSPVGAPAPGGQTSTGLSWSVEP